MLSYFSRQSPFVRKLWIAWFVLALTAVLGLVVGNRAMAYGMAIASAVAGWAGFFLGEL